MARPLLLLSGAATLSILTLTGTAVAVDCFVDGVDGSDTNDGKAEAAPVKSPGKIPSTCTVVKFKRGSEFKLATGVANLGLPSQMMFSTIKTLTNYGDASQPLPKFVKDHVDGSGGMIQVFSAVTIDGLYLSGSKSANAMTQLADGVGVMLGAGSKLINSEITLCDIGIMTSGDNVQVLNNYVHDLAISVDAPHGVDPNQVGGAEGIFVNSSHVEVAYNRFVNCTSRAEWVTITPDKPRCDGGATEVTVPLDKSGGGGEVTDVRIHHNFSYNSCGFFEVSTMPQKGATYVKGKFTNSIFHDNVMVDSGWISLLQLNNTKLSNITWANNTIIHHYLPTVQDASGNSIDLNDFGSSYIQAIPFNDMSSGVSGGGELSEGDVYWTNNLWYFDKQILDKMHMTGVDATHASTDKFLKNILIKGDKFVTADPGFLEMTSTSDPRAFDLLGSATGVIDQGVSIAEITTDYLDRPRPYGTALDLGAFEYQGTTPSIGGSNGTGGLPSAGGAASTSGGKAGVGGAVGSGGSKSSTTGGNGSGGSLAGTGGSAQTMGGSAQTMGGSAQTMGGSQAAVGGSAASETGGAAVAAPAGADKSGCSCSTPSKSSPNRAMTQLGLLMLGLGLRRHQRKNRRA